MAIRKRDKSNWFEAALAEMEGSSETPIAEGIFRRKYDPDPGSDDKSNKHFQVIHDRFAPNAYNGPQTKDFKDRVNSFMQAAESVANRPDFSAPYKTGKLKDLKLKAINDIDNILIKPITIPLLKDIPILGYLFKHKRDINIKTEVVICITTTLI